MSLGLKNRPPLERGPIEFIFALVRGDTAEQVSERVGKVADIATGHRSVIHAVNGPLVTMTFGTHKFSPALPASRLSLIADLRVQLAKDIKIIHGSDEGYFGLFGSQQTVMNYSFLVPQFDALLGALARLQFGEIEEFKP